MKLRPTSLAAAIVFAAAPLLPPLALAADDHGHSHDAPTATSPSPPRFAAVSEAFELVGVLHGRQIALYLDRTGDNSPVADAQIELEIGGVKFAAAKHGGDAFEVTLSAAPKPGVLPVTATVTVADAVVLLAGELDIHDEGEVGSASPIQSWKPYTAWAAGSALLLGALLFVARRVAARRARIGGAA